METKNVVYRFPTGFEVPVNRLPDHCSDCLTLIILEKTNHPDIEDVIHFDHGDVYEFIKDHSEDVFTKNITIHNDDLGLLSKDLVFMIGRRTEPWYTKKEFSYDTPASNTSSEYKVLIRIQLEEYFRDFIIDVPSRNFTSYLAMETAVENLHKDILNNEYKDINVDEEGGEIYIPVYNKYGDSDGFFFAFGNSEGFLEDYIVKVEIIDFFMKIDGYEYDPETRECLGRKEEDED